MRQTKESKELFRQIAKVVQQYPVSAIEPFVRNLSYYVTLSVGSEVEQKSLTHREEPALSTPSIRECYEYFVINYHSLEARQLQIELYKFLKSSNIIKHPFQSGINAINAYLRDLDMGNDEPNLEEGRLKTYSNLAKALSPQRAEKYLETVVKVFERLGKETLQKIVNKPIEATNISILEQITDFLNKLFREIGVAGYEFSTKEAKDNFAEVFSKSSIVQREIGE